MKNLEGIRARWTGEEPNQCYEVSVDGAKWVPVTLMKLKQIRRLDPVTYVERA